MVDNDLEWGTSVPLSTSVKPGDVYYTTKDQDKLPLLAYIHYGDVRLWWVIYEFNLKAIGHLHPLFLPAGLILRIPAKDRVTTEVVNAQGF